MRRVLVFLGVVICFCSYGQRDSLVGKTWMGHYTDFLKFDTLRGEATFYTEYTGLAKLFSYKLTDSSLTLNLGRGSDRLVFEYKYLGDSLWLSLVECSLPPLDSWFLKKPKVFYAIEKSSEAPWEKLYLSHSRYVIEVTKKGNIYADFSGYCTDIGGLVGHYRGQLNDTTLMNLNKLIEEAQIGNASSSGAVDGPPPIRYYLFTKENNFQGTSKGLGRQRAEPIYYLLKSIDYKALKFQNYIAGDSVEGVFVVDVMVPGGRVEAGTVEEIGSFRSNAKILKPTYDYNFTKDRLINRDRSKRKIRIYRLKPLDGFVKNYENFGDFIYLLSDSVLDTLGSSIITFQHIKDYSNLSKMPKEPKVYFVLKQNNIPEKNNTIIVNTCYPQAFMMGHPEQTQFFQKRKGFNLHRTYIQSPFKTKFERAYKKFILKDWKGLQREVKNSNVPDGGLIPNKKNGYKYGHI